ncbi:MAG: hypothetical protein MJE66_19975 [Proteobacteria bacterium]|nr:hypothetical protein [Pseudomonadota bacterium]
MRVAAVATLSLALVCGAAGTAGARSNPLEGIGVVFAKNLNRHTVTIGDQVYVVSARTALYGRHGERLSMLAIPVARDADGRLLSMAEATVRYSAVEHQGRLILDQLELITPEK